MSDFVNRLAARIADGAGYSQASGALFEAYVLGLLGEVKELSKQEIRQLINAAQVFYGAENESLKNEGSVLLSMILDLSAKTYPEIAIIARSLFANSGDFPNIKLLAERFPDLDFRFSFYSEAQIDFHETLNTVKELEFPLTDYQRALWADLTSDQDVITSAPTSAGKTHIILNYLLNKVGNSAGAFAAIIVPTRALISEVAGKIYELARDQTYGDELEICTIPREGEFASKSFFVMTQERLHELMLRGDISFDYLFVDEAHNISDKSRGVLLHLTIEKVLENGYPQIIISMPSSSYQNSFSTIFKDVEFKREITQSSPVTKIVMSVVPKNRNLIVSRHNSTDTTTIPKGFNGKNLADIVCKFGQGQSNIIYRNRTDYCETLAEEIAARLPKIEDNPLLAEAANYVEEFIHKEFTLADSLRKGVAFHYGPLPSSIRVMVENLVKDDQVKFITCTSTLAEGVNLPAKNLFLQNPAQPIMHQGSKRIEDVKINNITGRAGRMLQHFSGNIFLIEPETWAFKDYFDEKEDEEDKVPTYFKSLNEDFNLVLDALKGQFAHDEKDQYRFYTIANKLIREFSGEDLERTLNAEELTLEKHQLKELEENVRAAHDNLKIASFTLEANPTVGYIQQNKLFSFLEQLERFEEWVLPHPKSANLYDTLLRIARKLYDCGVYLPSDGYSLEHICLVTKKWIQGNSLKEIIVNQIEWDAREATRQSRKPRSVNASVRNVIKAINNDIRFRLSNALRCYQVLLDNVLISNDVKISNVKLHSFVEVGACEERLINLINLGLSREAAIELDNHLSDQTTINASKDLIGLHRSGQLEGIHAITEKELVKLLSD